jgi:hypothetical protein
MRHLIRIVDQAASGGAQNVLVVVGSGGVADTVADNLPGLHARVSLADVLPGNLLKSFDQPPEFDLCICSLEISELTQFSEMAKAVSPIMRKGGKILGFHANLSLRPFSPDDMSALRGLFNFPGAARVYYAGSEQSVRLMRKFRDAVSRRGMGMFGALTKTATMLLVVAPAALRANKAEAALPAEQGLQMPAECTSITVEVTV